MAECDLPKVDVVGSNPIARFHEKMEGMRSRTEGLRAPRIPSIFFESVENGTGTETAMVRKRSGMARRQTMAGALKRLWTPWRMAFIKTAHLEKGCFLCDLPKSKKDRDNLILKRGKKCYVILNKYPYNNGHLLVAPYRHIADIEKLSDAEALEMMRLTGASKLALDRTMHPHGYNVGVNLGRAAGAGVPGHVHLHVVPRWNGDTNFMPILGETKLMPLTLLESYDMLAKRLKP